MKILIHTIPVVFFLFQACITMAPVRRDTDSSELLTNKDSLHLFGYSDGFPAEVNEPEALPLVELDSAALADIINRNEKVVLYLWATWCSHCIFELPERVKLADSLEQNGVAFFFISTNYEVKSLQKYMFKSGYHKPIYILDDNYFSSNQVAKIANFRRMNGLDSQAQTGLPQYFLFKDNALLKGGYKDAEMEKLLHNL